MRPTMHKAVAAISAATGIRSGRVGHAARQLQQAGVLPTAVGATRYRLRPSQLATLVVASVLDVPIRSVADAAIEVCQLPDGCGGTFGDALAAALDHRQHAPLSVDLDRSFATFGDAVFGKLPAATSICRRCQIPPEVTREIIRRLDR